MGSQDKPATRRYTVEQKDQAVRLVRKIRAETGQAHGAVQRVAAQLGYGVESVRSWVKQADIDGGVTSGVTTAEVERVKKLEQENRELRRANESAPRDSRAMEGTGGGQASEAGKAGHQRPAA